MPGRAETFWAWFRDSEPAIRASYDSNDVPRLTALLDHGISLLGDGIGWELGPYADPANALVLSPQGRQDIPAVRAVVGAAPAMSGWRFFAGKPPKELKRLRFVVDEVEIDADGWRYWFDVEDGVARVALFASEADAPPEHLRERSSELVLEALLGEIDCLEHVGQLDFLVVTEGDFGECAPVRCLYADLNRALHRLS